ncbi:TPA: hypothetical protein I1733_002283 [Staphylococcus pseudintermedius]|nr:hypothetical protein [Staphylococcus pseudintermedius]EIS6479149.1 hypothetical protein [Staphylococcus pseudintermedius]EJA1886306.1 hypothetical protein [Staphylococcus pseudintermedius]MCE5501170.1 hypothetical protein [Staphylococcus pseudintermedius]MCE5523003.1 hypothetical protein [Staphylococcus pseudintermedius]
MTKILDYEKLDKMNAEIKEASKKIKAPDVEDMPYELPDTPEGFDDLTDEEIRYLAFGIKPD